MYRFTNATLITLVAVGAFALGASEAAVAGDPDENTEAAPPGPAPTIAIWNTEIRTVDADNGLRFTLEENALAIELLPEGERSLDYDVRCEVAQGSPVARMYMPPQLVSETRVRGQLASSRRMVVPLDLTPSTEGDEAGLANLYDTMRVTIYARGAAPDAPPLAMLQAPRG